MDNLELLKDYIGKITSDERLKPVHVSLLIALCERWIINDFNICYTMSRKILMERSRIKSKATYHKALQDLQRFGLVKYIPSYHPRHGSTIKLLKENIQITKREHLKSP
jgi:hypothetical protein